MRGAWKACLALAVVASCRAEAPPERAASTSSAATAPERFVWQRIAGGPSARSAHAMAYDRARGRTVLFGGQAGGAPLGDTWEWDGTTWMQACTDSACAATRPPARFAHAMAYDTRRSRTVLFGGQSDVVLGDTWEWDGARWTQQCTGAACTRPSKREGHVMAFDSTRGVTLVFGGQECTSGCALPSDTWAWNGAAWQILNAAGPARLGAAMAFDTSRGEAILFGGANVVPLRDTWAWDGGAWIARSSGGPDVPAARTNAALAYDAPRSSAVLFGGSSGDADVWGWSEDAWTQLDADPGPSGRLAHAMVYDDTRMRFVLFGGFSGGVYLDDAWEGLRFGSACTTPDQCATGLCVDGVCCATACGVCEACNVVGSRGTCTPVTSRPDPDSCIGDRTCNADGRCLAAIGTTCGARTECASTYCVDGVCCNEACASPCRACRPELTTIDAGAGICGDVPAGNDPHDGCPDDGVCSCQRDGTCDGRGSCRAYGSETDCSQCGDPTASALKAHCDGHGVCLARSTIGCLDDHRMVSSDGVIRDCTPYRCASNGCSQACDSSDGCADGYACTADHRCAAPPPPPADAAANACTMHASREGDAAGAWIGVAVALLALRRRATSCPSA